MFEVGEIILCVNGTPSRPLPPGLSMPIRGQEYTVRAIEESRTYPGVFGLLLEEIINPPDKFGDEIKFWLWRFRKKQPSQESIDWADEVLEQIKEHILEEV